MSGPVRSGAIESTLAGEPPGAPRSRREQGRPRSLHVHRVEIGRIVLLQIWGPVDGVTTPALGETLQPWLQPGQQIILDLRHVDYLESPGLRLLTAAVDELHPAGGQIRLIVGPESRVERTLCLAGLDRRMPIFHTGPDAWAGRAPGSPWARPASLSLPES